MGYSTYFSGSFELTPKLNVSQIETIKNLCEYNVENPEGTPGDECVWTVSDDGTSIESVDEEKLYDWDEWLRYLLTNVLEPAGVKANGSVVWDGEDTGDAGVIFVKDNDVRFVGIESMPEPDWDTPEEEEEEDADNKA